MILLRSRYAVINGIVNGMGMGNPPVKYRKIHGDMENGKKESLRET